MQWPEYHIKYRIGTYAVYLSESKVMFYQKAFRTIIGVTEKLGHLLRCCKSKIGFYYWIFQDK